MTKIRTFAVVRDTNGSLVAHDASVSVELSDGIGIHLVGISDIHVREILLRTITALNASGFVIPGRKIVIDLNLGDYRRDPTLIAELLDLPIAVAFMAERNFAKFDTSVRYIGRLCPDGRIDDLDGNVIRACRMKWPPNFVSSLTYPDGRVRPAPGHTYLTTIMRDHRLMDADDAEELVKVQTRGTVVSSKVNEVHGVPICYFKLQTTKTVSPNDQDGESERTARRGSNEVDGGSNEGDGILSCVATNEAGGMPTFERMARGVEVEVVGRRDKSKRIIVHKITIL